MGLFDVYSIVDTSLYEGQVCQNAYFYQSQSDVGTPDASDVAAAYLGQMLPTIKTMQESDLVHTEIRVVNLFNDSDKFLQSISVPGTAAYGSDRLPVFNAIGFQLVGDNGAVRNGSKRYAGLDEGIQQNGVITNGTFITQANLVADLLFETLVHGIIPTFVPVIVKRILDGTEYRLPENIGEAVLSNVVEAAFSTLLTSQTSRKIGNGE